jgi:hypothetical protein
MSNPNVMHGGFAAIRLAMVYQPLNLGKVLDEIPPERYVNYMSPSAYGYGGNFHLISRPYEAYL